METTGLEATAVIEQGARRLYRGLARLALDPEITAFVIPTSQINPERPLAESFPYLTEDVSLELRDAIDALKLEPDAAGTFAFDIADLVNN